MKGTLWVTLVFTGLALMWAMRWTTRPTLDAILIRASAASYLAAGTVGAAGWIGDLLRTTIGWVNDLVESVGRSAVGTTAVVGLLWLALTGMWVLTMLPESWFKKQIPDWLAFSGLIIPSVAGAIPGPIGEAMRSVIQTISGLMIQLVTQMAM